MADYDHLGPLAGLAERYDRRMLGRAFYGYDDPEPDDDPWRSIDEHLADAILAVHHNEPVCGSRPANGRRTKADLAQLDALIVAVAEFDHPVSLRGVFYRTSSLGGVPKSEAGYRTVGRELLKLRRAGLIPYRQISDGTRYVLHGRRFANALDALEHTAKTYRRRLWTYADVSVEVFAEKDAISGVVHPVCDKWDVPFGVVRGYSSETFAHSVAEGLSRVRPTVLLNLGDHDPSGVNAWHDFADKVRRFAPECEIEARRIAVTPDQIDELNLPTRPTKKSDTRAATFAGESVEVDAIPAPVLRQIVNDEIGSYIDENLVVAAEAAEESERNVLMRLLEREVG